MKYIKIHKPDAETVKKYISKMNILDSKRNILHNRTYAYIPIRDYTKQNIKKLSELLGANITVMEKNKKEIEGKRYVASPIKTLKNDNIVGGYDLLGNIAVIKIRGFSKDSVGIDLKKVTESILKSNNKVTTVLMTAGPITGQYRIRKFSYVGGKRGYMAAYKENGAVFGFDVRKVFFSNRLSYERGRISRIIKRGEDIAVPFAGVGPFPIVIAINSKPRRILAIEINNYAYEYMKKNILLNKLEGVITPVEGDIRKVAAAYKGFADRVIMQMPTQSMEFLDEMIMLAKDKATSHIYVFCNSINGIENTKVEIRKFMNSRGYSVKYLFDRIVRTYSKNEIEAVIDVRFWKRKK